MRNYSSVSPTFWTGATGRRLRSNGGSNALLIALYLITAPSTNMIGLYYLPLALITHETGVPLEGVREALRALEDEGFAFYDEDEEMAWIPEMARFQVGERLDARDKQCKGVATALALVRKSKFYAAFWSRYHEGFHLPPMGVSTPFEAPSRPLPSQDQDQHHDQPQEQSQEQEPGQEQGPPRCKTGEVGPATRMSVARIVVRSSDGGRVVGPSGVPGSGLRVPTSRVEAWQADTDLSASGSDVPSQQGKGDSGVDPGVPSDVQEIFDAWNKAAESDPIFERVEGVEAERLVPKVREVLRDHNARKDLLDIFAAVPVNPFYSGLNDKRFVAFLRHYVSMTPDRLHLVANAARREQLRHGRGKGSGAKAKPRAEVDAATARRMLNASRPSPSGNDFHSRLGLEPEDY